MSVQTEKYLLVGRCTSRSSSKGVRGGWSGVPGGTYNRYHNLEVSITVNRMETTHDVLDMSTFAMSHMMMSALDCLKPSFDHGLNGGCVGGMDRWMVCSGSS